MQKHVLIATFLLMAFGFSNAQVVTGERRRSEAADTTPAKARDIDAYRAAQQARKAEKEERNAIVRKAVVSTNIALWAPSLKIEGRVSQYITVGGVIKARLIYFSGAKIDPFVRWYPRGTAPRGFFVQLKGSVGLYHTRILGQSSLYPYAKYNQDNLPDTYFQAYGGGITTGYQLLVGREHRGAIEFFGGFQYIYYTIPITSDFIVQKLAIMMPLEIGIRFGGAF